MSISRWFTPPHLRFLGTVIEMTTQLMKYFCHFTKGEYTTPYWLEVTWRKKWLDLTWTIIDLTWLEQLCDLTWLEQLCDLTWLNNLWLDSTWLEKIVTWLDSRLDFWLDLTCDSSKGDLLQHCHNLRNAHPMQCGHGNVFDVLGRYSTEVYNTHEQENRHRRAWKVIIGLFNPVQI